MTSDQAKTFDEELGAMRERKRKEAAENARLYIQNRQEVQKKVDEGLPCREEEAALYLKWTDYRTEELEEQAKRLIMEGKFDEGRSLPEPAQRPGERQVRSYFVTYMSIALPYPRPQADGSYVGFHSIPYDQLGPEERAEVDAQNELRRKMSGSVLELLDDDRLQ